MSNNSLKAVKATGGGKRLVCNDLAKSLGMLLIVWGHIRLGDWSNAFVYAFHIPLFFALSGMMFDRSRYPDFKTLLRKKVKSLLMPYFIFSFITWVVWAVFSYVTHANVDSYLMPLAQTIIAQGSGGYLVHNVPLWFVTCLFMMEVLYYFLSNMSDGKILLTTMLMATASYILINYCTVFDFTEMSWNIEVALLGVPFYAVGHLAVKKWSHEGLINIVSRHKKESWILVFLLAALVLVGSNYNGSISFGHATLGKNVFVGYACALMGVTMMIALCILLSELPNKISDSKLFNFLIWFGQNSFNAMAIHNPIKGIVAVIVGMAFHCGSYAVSFNGLYSTITFFITLLLTVVGLLIINRITIFFKHEKNLSYSGPSR